MALAIDLAVAKTNKYASRESGDTAELLERPGGGLSVVTVDGQGSGAAAKSLSLMLTSRAVALLKEGVRDGAVARAVHDVLFAYRQGKVSASLDILSVDLKTKSVLVTRNSTTPLLVRNHEGWIAMPASTGPIGLYHFTRPAVIQFPVELSLTICLFTDGIASAGAKLHLTDFDVLSFVTSEVSRELRAASIADIILQEAVGRDRGRPGDDMTVVAMTLRDHQEEPLVRRLDVFVPLP